MSGENDLNRNLQAMDMRSVVAVILGGGRGTRLYPLTKFRAKPAVPLGGKYRLIDIPISNCLHDSIRKIYVLTQFNSESLNRHISQTYRFDEFSQGFVQILAAEQTMDNPNWYQGTADAVRQQLRHMMGKRVEQFLILSGDHLYRMNYRSFIASHRNRGADVSIAVQPVPRERAPAFGILQVDDEDRIVDFHEKPDTEEELDRLRTHTEDGEEVYLASMGIYLFDRAGLKESLQGTEREDFGKHIIPRAIDTQEVFAHRFDGYWEDIGTIEAFYEANMALTEDDPPFSFYEHESPIYTHPRFLAPSEISNCHLRGSIIGDGSRIVDSEIDHSVIGLRSQIGPDVSISRSILMGADYYEEPMDIEENREKGIPDIGIGEGSEIEGAIIDKDARIGQDVTIKNVEDVEESEEQDHYMIRDGIVVIPKYAVIPSGTVI